jgi:hypothetical protein
MAYPSLERCGGISVGTGGAGGTLRRKYGGKQKGWSVEEETG